MIVKKIDFAKTGQAKLIKGIDTIADAVRSTLGARGSTVLIESSEHIGGITITKDGITVARSINLEDAVENLAVMLVREASSRTADQAGDGTTTAIVLTQAIIHNALAVIKSTDNKIEVIRAMQRASDDIVKELSKVSVKVDEQSLIDVARISANNDDQIGGIISDAYKKVGVNGVVTVENSDGSDTYCDVSEGMRLSRGYTSRYFITDKKTNECVLENPYVLVLNHVIENLSGIEQVLADVMQKGRSILIIGELSANVLNTLNLNRARNGMKVCVILPPQFGWKKNEMMEDIAHVTGATYFSEDTGDNLQLVRMEDLGRLKRAVVSSDTTIMIRAEDTNDTTAELVEKLWQEHQNSRTQDFIKERIAVISGRVGVIHVGADSDIELKEKRDRVDDAVCATRAALEDGVLPGGGVALRDIKIKPQNDNVSDRIGCSIIEKSLSAPFNQILDNAGLSKPSKPFPKGRGFNVNTEKVGKMMDMGIIDPTKVTKTAVINAISVATTILSTNAIITNVRESDR